jgi:hypothetical protein
MLVRKNFQADEKQSRQVVFCGGLFRIIPSLQGRRNTTKTIVAEPKNSRLTRPSFRFILHIAGDCLG